jgi:hypothetical protein
MPRSRSLIPAYLHHPASGQARVRVRLADGRTKDLYLGAHNSPESREEYRRVVALVARNGGVYPSAAAADLSLAGALVLYLRKADRRYRDADGRPTRGQDDVKRFSRLLRTHTDPIAPIVTFNVSRLKAVQEALAGKYVRIQADKFMVQFRLFARWLFLEDHIELEQYEKLRAVPGLRAGRAGVKEGKGRRAADPTAVEKVLPLLPPALAAAVQAIRWSGARPFEILGMRVNELDISGDVWKFAPLRHKGGCRNKQRLIFIGPEAATEIRPLLEGLGAADFVFSPRRSEATRHEARSAARKTPQWPSHMSRNIRKRRGAKTREVYDVNSAGRALKVACMRAGVSLTLYELRHLRGAELVERGNVELARAALGHSHAAMTGHYARSADAGLAEQAARIGPVGIVQGKQRPTSSSSRKDSSVVTE